MLSIRNHSKSLEFSLAVVTTWRLRAQSLPQVPYEMLYAGLPVLLTRQSNSPRKLMDQPFVQAADFSEDDPAALNLPLEEFLEMIHQKHIRIEIEYFLRNEMVADNIYNQICVKMGVCWSGAHVYEDS